MSKTKTNDKEVAGFPRDNSRDENVSERIASYTTLLNDYIKFNKLNMYTKYTLKLLFFIASICSLGAVAYFFYLALQYSFNYFENLNTDISIESILGIATIMLPAISSLIIAFIKIPEIIAKYLFNAKEDSNMNSIIKNIQDYDKVLIEKEDKAQIALLVSKSQNMHPESKDDSLETLEN